MKLPPGSPPKRMFTAVRRALKALPESKGRLMRPGDVTPPWISDDIQADFTHAVAVVELDLPLWDDDHLYWSDAERMVTEMGFSCEVQIIRYLVVFYRME